MICGACGLVRITRKSCAAQASSAVGPQIMPEACHSYIEVVIALGVPPTRLGTSTGSFHLKKVCVFFFHNTGDNFLCNLHIAVSACELLVKCSYVIRLSGIPRQTDDDDDDDDDGRTTDDDDDDLSYFSKMVIVLKMIN